jgi:hypothetical protein
MLQAVLKLCESGFLPDQTAKITGQPNPLPNPAISCFLTQPSITFVA